MSEKYKGLFKDQVAADLSYESIKSADQATESTNSSVVKKSSLYEAPQYGDNQLKAHAKIK